jgi:tetratricopeptide (TPR) repeat protein
MSFEYARDRSAADAIQLGELAKALAMAAVPDEALAAFEQMQQIAPRANSASLGIGQVYLAQGEYDKALKAMMASFEPAGINYYRLGATYAAKGDHPRALETMQKAFQVGFSDFAAIDNSPYFDSIRNDPQFRQMLSKYRK